MSAERMSAMTALFRWVVPFIIIAAIVVKSFWNSLDNAFAFDDHLAITNNHDVKDPETHRIWTDDIWGKKLSAHDSHKSFRPLLILLFRTLWSISSEARWFREVSLAAHIVSTYMFYCVSLIIWNNTSISLAAAVLFAAHPIHVESVAAVVNMAEAFSACFILLSYIIFLHYTVNTLPAKRSILYWIGLVASLVAWVALVVLASLFKETGISCCLLVVCKTTMDLVLWLLRAQTNKKANRSSGTEFAKSAVYFLFTATAFAAVHVYLAFRSMMTSVHRTEMLSDANKTLYALVLKPILERETESYLESSQLLRKAENPFALLTGWEKIYSVMYLHYLYMIKLVYPAEQSPEYAFNCIPKVSSAHDFRAQMSFLMYSTIIIIGVYGLYRALFCGKSRSSVEKSLSDVSAVEKSPTLKQINETELTTDTDDSLTKDDTTTTGVEAPVGKTEGPFCDQDVTNIDDDNVATPIPSLPSPQPAVSETVPTTEQNPSAVASVQSCADDANRSDKDNDNAEDHVAYATAIPADAVLHSLMLLLVFFLPASGIVFRLGTLLAERLLYTPSLASCMLLSAAWYGVCWTVARLLCCCCGGAGNGRHSNKRSLFWFTPVLQVFFWAGVIALTIAYAQRTLTYSKVWHDDNTLFLESLAVCPQSAKMNLQVSKVWSQRGNFKKARKHLEIAQKIDPDFCDTGYQDVIITMSLAASEGSRNSLDIAAEKAVKNLHCIYTNSGTINLLNHIWSSQLQAAQATNNKRTIYAELQKQGNIAFKGDVKFLAAQKYIEASSIAFDAQEVEDAVELATKAEKIVTKLEAAFANASSVASANDETELSADIRCRIFTLNGCFRASQMQIPKKQQQKRSNKKKGSVSQSVSAEKMQRRIESLLSRAVFGDCTDAALQLPESGMPGAANRNLVVVEHLPLAVNQLISLWTTKMNGAKQADGASVALDAATTMPQQLSAYAADLTAVYHVTELLHQRTSFLRPSIPSVPVSSSKTTSAALAVPGKIEPPDSSQHPVDKISELRDVVAKLAANAHHMAGAQYLHLHNVSAAVNSFRQSLLVHSPVYTQRVMAAKYGNGVNRKDLPEQQMVLDDFISVKRTHETCTTLHWFSETLASHADTTSDGLSQELAQYLKLLIRCLKTNLYASPKLNLDKLRAILKSLPKAVKAPPHSAEVEVKATAKV